MSVRKLLLAASLAAALPNAAFTGTVSYTGVFTDPNQVFTASFTLPVAAPLTIQTYGYGGTANAPGGTNAAGIVIAPGGFDPYVSLFLGTGAGATFLASNDDGICGTVDLGNCFDSTLQVATAAADAYTLALTLPANFSFAENQGSGTLGDGFIGFATSFDDAAGNVRSGGYAVDITSTAIPEAGSLALLATAIAVIATSVGVRISRSE
jgi:hypothetical protein